MLIKAVLILGQEDKVVGKLMKRHNLFPLQLGNVVQHLVLFCFQVVLLYRLHNRGVVSSCKLVAFGVSMGT